MGAIVEEWEDKEDPFLGKTEEVELAKTV